MHINYVIVLLIIIKHLYSDPVKLMLCFIFIQGITILGGENSKKLDLGIFVKSVTEGGPAWNDGRLKAG